VTGDALVDSNICMSHGNRSEVVMSQVGHDVSSFAVSVGTKFLSTELPGDVNNVSAPAKNGD
jgi:hypothetical protein